MRTLEKHAPAVRLFIEISVKAVHVFCFPFNAVCVRLDMGLLASEVLSTLPKPTIALVIPLTVPEKLGLASGALVSSAVCVNVDMGLPMSVVLSTLPKPTIRLSDSMNGPRETWTG
ncbi:MAG: hypothetical protein ACKPKO_41005, partial [Candidatus Fonsibacter sp.]